MKIPINFQINFIVIWDLIKKWILKRKEKTMCIRKWFSSGQTNPQTYGPVAKRALLFAINDYPDGGDLNGCINDQEDAIKRLKAIDPDVPFDIRAFQDKQVTRAKFLLELEKAVSVLRPFDLLVVHYSGHGTQVYDRHNDEEDGYDEAIYLYDWFVTDDEVRDVLVKADPKASIVLMFDSCFSGSMTRNVRSMKQKFHPHPDFPVREKIGKKFLKSGPLDQNWIVLSGCSENQTSADAFIGGMYRGAFSYYAFKVLKPSITYNEWIELIHLYLPSNNFDQNPTLEGKPELCSRLVFT